MPLIPDWGEKRGRQGDLRHMAQIKKKKKQDGRSKGKREK